jgi:hypothetical protein
MEKQDIKEFIEDDGTLINSKMTPNLNRQAMSKQTTDQHVATSRQGMVWMNYRRFYGEADGELPFAKEADKWEKDPESFFKFLKSKNKQGEFNKYFAKKPDGKSETTNTPKILKEYQRDKMKKLVEDLVTAKREGEGELVKKKDEDKPSIGQLKEREPALFKKITSVAETVKSVFTDKEQDVIIDYITQIINS